MNFAGITSIFSEKKWVFAYTVLVLAYFNVNAAQFVQIVTVLTPSVLALAGVSKYVNKDKP